METADSPYADDEERAKLFPEWGASADSQILVVGLGAALAFLVFLGWNSLRSDDDDDLATVGSSILDTPSGAVDEAVPAIVGADLDLGQTATTVGTATDAAAGTAAPLSTSTTAVATSAAPAGPTAADMQAAVAGFPGDITGSVDGSVALLAGFVANEGERAEAETAAAAVVGVDRVDNQLVVLEPQVAAALAEAGVVGGAAAGAGTAVTITGTIQSEDARAAALTAAAGVDGVTDIDDQLTVSIAADLNELPQVQFATGSAEILPASFADLDAAAALITEAGEIDLDVIGWTDVQGGEARNLALSQARADSVVAYLVEAGATTAQLRAIGKGETEQFAPGESSEALQANRVVLFEQVG